MRRFNSLAALAMIAGTLAAAAPAIAAGFNHPRPQPDPFVLSVQFSDYRAALRFYGETDPAERPRVCLDTLTDIPGAGGDRYWLHSC